MAKKEYKWKLGEPPPPIDAHTKIKHRIYENYINKYIKILNQKVFIPSFNFVIVDAFAGGGLYCDGGLEYTGSPLRIWNTINHTEDEINENRTKKFSINKYLFLIEKKKSNFDYLYDYIQSCAEQHLSREILLTKGSFEKTYKSVIEQITKISPNTRVIFILDQYGYSHVPYQIIRDIFNKLPKSEIILTLSPDEVLDYIQNPNSEVSLPSQQLIFPNTPIVAKKKSDMLNAFNKIELNTPLMQEIKDKHGHTNEWRLFIQHHILDQIKLFTNAKHYTPFFLSREKSHRSMWLVHLTNHYLGADVMREIFHSYVNDSKTLISHYGGHGFDMLGYSNRFENIDSLIFNKTDAYDFNKQAQESTYKKLLDQIPQMLYNNGKISFENFYSINASDTPANSKMIKEALIELIKSREIKVDNRNPRSALKKDDIIYKNPQLFIFPKQR
jgi:three-Cys-motif partner protein